MPPLIHFWSSEGLAREVAGWEPDRDPQRFATSVGHALLELYVRLRDSGSAVALGEKPARDAALTVVAAASVRKDPAGLRRALVAVARTGGRVALIRSDTPLSWRFPLAPTCELMPYEGLAVAANQRSLPPLPQRGLVPRRDGKLERIRTLALKCNPVTLPEELRDGRIGEALAADGVRLWLDVPATTDGSDQAWHDFGDVDAVLCARSEDVGSEWTSVKPPTKLINAWVAGCVSIARREPAYVELARDGEDVLFLDDLTELPETIRRLNEDPALLERLHEGARRRGREFATERVVAAWRKLLEEVAASPPSRRRAARARAAATATAALGARRHVALAFDQRVLRRLRAHR